MNNIIQAAPVIQAAVLNLFPVERPSDMGDAVQSTKPTISTRYCIGRRAFIGQIGASEPCQAILDGAAFVARDASQLCAGRCKGGARRLPQNAGGAGNNDFHGRYSLFGSHSAGLDPSIIGQNRPCTQFLPDTWATHAQTVFNP